MFVVVVAVSDVVFNGVLTMINRLKNKTKQAKSMHRFDVNVF